MKRKALIIASILGFAAMAFTVIADLNGKWSGTLVAPDGNSYPLNYTFKIDNDKLTGQGQSQQGSVDLQDGKIKGDSLFFSIDVGGVKIINSGKYFAVGDSIGLNIDYQGMIMHATLKRAADK